MHGLAASKDAHKNLHFRLAKISYFMASKDAHKNLEYINIRRMKIDICLTATNTKSAYINQIPTFIKIWLLFGIQPVIILVNNEIPEKFLDYKQYIILFDPKAHGLENMHTAYIAQSIRIFYPALFPADKVVIIADIDIMPISRSFFLDSVKDLSQEVFVNYRRYNGQLNICYNVTSAGTWSKIFDIDSMDNLIQQLKCNYNNNYNAYKNCPGWFTDQVVLTRKVTEYQQAHPSNQVIYLDKRGYKVRRLDKRDRKEIILRRGEIIRNIGSYTDFHMTSKNERYIALSNEIKEAIFSYLLRA
jgi:hypothetical protein